MGKRILHVFEGEHPRVETPKLPFGGNILGLVLGEISKVHSWKRKNTWEEEDNGGEKESFNAKFVFSLSFSVFLSFDGCIYFFPYVLVSFLRV